jgi:hypothetical protein
MKIFGFTITITRTPPSVGDLGRMARHGKLPEGKPFNGRNLDSIDLTGADCSRHGFRDTKLRDAKMTGGNFESSYFRGADMKDAYAPFADFIRAEFYGVSMRGADLRFANFSHAIFNRVCFDGAQMNGAILSEYHNIIATSAPVRQVERSDGHTFYLFPTTMGWYVKAGCRLFTMAGAYSHWINTRGDTALGDETMDILELFDAYIERDKTAKDAEAYKASIAAEEARKAERAARSAKVQAAIDAAQVDLPRDYDRRQATVFSPDGRGHNITLSTPKAQRHPASDGDGGVANLALAAAMITIAHTPSTTTATFTCDYTPSDTTTSCTTSTDNGSSCTVGD